MFGGHRQTFLNLGVSCETHLVAFVIPSIGVIGVSNFRFFEDGCYDVCNTCRISFILKGEEMGSVKLRGVLCRQMDRNNNLRRRLDHSWLRNLLVGPPFAWI